MPCPVCASANAVVVVRAPGGFGVAELRAGVAGQPMSLAIDGPANFFGPRIVESFAELRAWLGTVWNGLRLVSCPVAHSNIVAEVIPARRMRVARYRSRCRTCGRTTARGEYLSWSRGEGTTCLECLGGGDA